MWSRLSLFLGSFSRNRLVNRQRELKMLSTEASMEAEIEFAYENGFLDGVVETGGDVLGHSHDGEEDSGELTQEDFEDLFGGSEITFYDLDTGEAREGDLETLNAWLAEDRDFDLKETPVSGRNRGSMPSKRGKNKKKQDPKKEQGLPNAWGAVERAKGKR